jgi:hypothetical protein
MLGRWHDANNEHLKRLVAKALIDEPMLSDSIVAAETGTSAISVRRIRRKIGNYADPPYRLCVAAGRSGFVRRRERAVTATARPITFISEVHSRPTRTALLAPRRSRRLVEGYSELSTSRSLPSSYVVLLK